MSIKLKALGNRNFGVIIGEVCYWLKGSFHDIEAWAQQKHNEENESKLSAIRSESKEVFERVRL